MQIYKVSRFPNFYSIKIKHITDEYERVVYSGTLGPRESKFTLSVTNNLLFLTVSKAMKIN